MTDSLVENIADWSAMIGIAIGIIAWWFAREDAGRKSDELERYKSDSKKEVAGINAVAALANEGQAKANKAAAEANERAAILEKETTVARLELEHVKRRVADRVLSPEKQNLVTDLLKPRSGSKVTIVSIVGNNEAHRFANQFKDAFTKAGWIVKGIDPKMDPSGQAFGIIVCVKDTSSPPPQATFIVKALTDANISVGYSENREVPDDEPWFAVGSK